MELSDLVSERTDINQAISLHKMPLSYALALAVSDCREQDKVQSHHLSTSVQPNAKDTRPSGLRPKASVLGSPT